MKERLVVCFYTGGKPFKPGTNLRYVSDALEGKGIICTSNDDQIEPDVYVFEKAWHETRYHKPVIIRAENLIGPGAREQHCFNRGDAIVFNSQWLRRLYFHTYGTELPNVWVIPPAFRNFPLRRHAVPDVTNEQHILCISKWWKRPYKRFRLIAWAFDYLNRQLGYPNAKLHVMGWLRDRPMPYVESGLPLWRLSRRIRENPNIIYYQKSFHNAVYEDLLSIAHIVVHVSAIDSGPQVVMEAMSQRIPVVITNNMGASEWIREVGPRSGIIVELDNLTRGYDQIADLLNGQYESNTRSRLEKATRLFKRVRSFYSYYKVCSSTSGYKEVACAVKRILDNYSWFQYVPPRKFTMDGIAKQWLTVIRSVVKRGLERTATSF